jgi:hypothetical protein
MDDTKTVKTKRNRKSLFDLTLYFPLPGGEVTRGALEFKFPSPFRRGVRGEVTF